MCFGSLKRHFSGDFYQGCRRRVNYIVISSCHAWCSSGCHSLNNGDHVGGTSDYVFQLDQETVDALRYMESYFTFKNNKLRVKAARAST